MYSEKNIEALFSGFRIVDKEYYRVKNNKEIRKISGKEASSLPYNPDDYCVVLVNAIKKS